MTPLPSRRTQTAIKLTALVATFLFPPAGFVFTRQICKCWTGLQEECGKAMQAEQSNWQEANQGSFYQPYFLAENQYLDEVSHMKRKLATWMLLGGIACAAFNGLHWHSPIFNAKVADTVLPHPAVVQQASH